MRIVSRQVRIEQGIAKGWSTSRICRHEKVSAAEVAEVRRYLDRVVAEDEPLTLASVTAIAQGRIIDLAEQAINEAISRHPAGRKR